MSTTQVDTTFVITLGGEIACRDGHTGHVHRLVIDPKSRTVTDVVVEHGLLRHRVVVPASHIVRTENEVTHLDLDGYQLAAFPAYLAVDLARPDPTWIARHGAVPGDITADARVYTPWSVFATGDSTGALVRRHLHTGVAEPGIPVGRSTRVASSTTPVGHLYQVLLDPETHAIRSLVVRAGHIHTDEVRIPTDQISGIADGDILIAADR